ncbi:MAG: hydroxymyristoyl-ACP dehydratase, partial [Sphingobacteriales bacterium]
TDFRLYHVDENGVKGSYIFDKRHSFYASHFKKFPVTPGVILTETMAQIGLVCLGIYLAGEISAEEDLRVVMTSAAVDFLKPVYPGERVIVTSEKIYFRFNKLSCRVFMENANGDTVCKGTVSGMLISN